MAYTVVSVFPATVNTEEITSELKNQGFSEADIIVSKSKIEDESAVGDYKDDEKTRSFWDHMFVSDNELLDAYSRESVGKINVVVYTSNITEAQSAKKIMDQHGALKVYNKPSFSDEKSDTAGLPEDVYNGIIAKARHNLYFLDSERTSDQTSRGMSDTMDDLGSKD
ncbi:hypothetical protein OMO38_12510 [Chryseobacterium sp. 09-1422]|uniref:General stress protein 17M-like domain-containing protein n=1 Tax=Chryseobacterium kimseyorum TaxID=2984028 RepID=A0ABT3I0C6_9FLAO|nr:hypothetical protein [Chryseobacterium kimseyorum]MCW3169343.1 hypothetical protein [Chryseobacterium kimseyorum]